MKIIATHNWNRRDFYYTEECESCGRTNKNCSGYDDDNYYNNVQANKKCKDCGKSSNDLTVHENTTPVYNSNIVM